MPLPEEPFELLLRKKAKVAPDLSIKFDGNNYSMLKKFVGDVVEVRATSTTVGIFNEFGDLLKSYPRCYGKREWIYDEETKPRTASDYSYWSPDYFLMKASMIGPCTHLVIEVILNSEKGCKSKVFRRCYGILNFANRYGSETLERCAASAVEVGKYNYSYIRDTIQGFTMENEEEEKEEPEQKMKYKVDDSKYSLARLTKIQEEKMNLLGSRPEVSGPSRL